MAAHLDRAKIKRELTRIWHHLMLPFEYVYSPVRVRAYDKRKAKLTKTARGQGADLANTVIYLIYQPNGLLASTFASCKHLIENDFSVVLVSNCPLKDDDRQKLLSVCHTVIERPNFGYDFGGYRDGILHVLDHEMRTENLLVLNDSVWFPVFRNCNFLSEVKQQGADLYGVVLGKGLVRPHLQSFFYNFKANVVGSAFFKTYWQNLPLSNYKFNVIKKCELRLSGEFERAGYTVSQKAEASDCTVALSNLNDEELKEVLASDQLITHFIGRKLNGLTTEGLNWRAIVLEKYREIEVRQYPMRSHPYLILRELKIPLIKKDKAVAYKRQRAVMLRPEFAAMLHPVVLEEIKTWDQ